MVAHEARDGLPIIEIQPLQPSQIELGLDGDPPARELIEQHVIDQLQPGRLRRLQVLACQIWCHTKLEHLRVKTLQNPGYYICVQQISVYSIEEVRMEMFQLLKPKQVWAATGLSRGTVYGLIRSGELKSIKCGRAIRIPSTELDNWLQHKLDQER